MDRKRRLALIFATVAVALGAGHIVQNGKGRAPKMATSAPTPAEAAIVASEQDDTVEPPVQKPVVVVTAAATPKLETVINAAMPAPVTPAPALLPETAITLAATDAVSPQPAQMPEHIIPASLTDPLAPTPVLAAATTEDACAVTLDLTAEPNAMIGLTLLAPCAPETRVVLRHAGLTVTGKTSITGSLFTALPALDAKGDVSATLKGLPTVDAKVDVPDMASVRRFAVQWQNDDSFQLHAFENGAAFGAPGHISASVPQMPKAGEAAAGGYLTVLGSPSVELPMLAEV
ncbi:MAG: hypothetical protein ACRCSU_07055, partial [Paracoccaceae bacterium]